MLSFINSWAQGIILAVIISCIIEIILPEGNNKKYVKTVIGIYVLFVIVYPLVSAVSTKNVNINKIIDTTTSQMSEFESSNITIETNSYIEETYREKLKEEMTQKLKEKGYSIDSLNLYIETENEDIYGKINGIVMQVSKIEKTEEIENENIIKNEVSKVESVNIRILNNTAIDNENNTELGNITKEEIETIKDYLNTTYEIEKKKIYINE